MEGDKESRYRMIEGAAEPAGCYSHVVLAHGFAFVSGQGPKNPETGVMSPVFAEQVRQTISNLRTILEGVGLGLEDVVKMNVYLTDPSRFKEYNAIYSEYFPTLPPARTTIGCWLPGILIEIDCIAARRLRRSQDSDAY
jgi:2-iminobutanoate/2-iminopropanoate deaminase